MKVLLVGSEPSADPAQSICRLFASGFTTIDKPLELLKELILLA